MKQCPQCNADYADDTLNYCLDDGTPLVGANGGEPATAVMVSFGREPMLANSVDEKTRVFRPDAPAQSAQSSIAVLPFVNMSAVADNEYFCDGLAEELLNALAKIDDLKVAARTASFSFRGRNAPMDEIGRTLNVNTILEGSVRKAGDRVRITVQLINASDGYHIWSDRYDRDMRDIFEIQDEITLAVVDALKLKLLAPEKRAMLKRHTNDAEAYQLYLRGRFFFYKRTPEAFLKAIEYFEKAIEIDDHYAVAISGLADTYVFLGFYEMVAPSQAATKLTPLIERAYEIDNTLTETNTSMALLTTLYNWDHRGSLKFFERAITADPKYAFAYHLESAVSAVLGDYDRAFAAELRAIELDPFTPVYNASLAWWYYLAGDNERAVAQSKRTIEIAPNHFFAFWVLGLTYARQGAFPDAVVAFQQSLALNQFEPHVRADLARVFAIMGEKEEAISILREFEEQSTTEYVSPGNLAKIYAGLGDKEKVIEFLEKACEDRSVRLPWLLVDPCLELVHGDPRYERVCRTAGLR